MEYACVVTIKHGINKHQRIHLQFSSISVKIGGRRCACTCALSQSHLGFVRA